MAPFPTPRPLSALLALPLLSSLAQAQTWEVDALGTATLGPGVGFVVGAVGDLDGDGLRDALVSSVSDGNGRGRVYAVSSANGAVIHSLPGVLQGDQFGHSVAGLGDLDGDGVADFAVGAPSTNLARPGAASAISGATGQVLWTATGEADRSNFGWVVAGVGDVNSDGIEDVGVCAPGYDPPGLTNAGRVYVHSGADGQRLRTFTGTAASGFLGASCGSAGDANGDGVGDMVMCSLGGGTNGRGEATVVSGADSSVLWSVSAGTVATQYGNYFSGLAGDIDADGVSDVYVIDYQNAGNRGRLFVYSGTDGTLLRSIRGPAGSRWLFGRVRIGDLDGDGHDDLVVCSSLDDRGGVDAGAVSFFSGATGESLGRLTSDTAGRNMGSDCVSVGDLDGDGSEDLFVGVGALAPGVGGGYFLPTRPAPPTTSCAGAVNSTGSSGELSYRGSLRVADREFSLDLQGLPAQSLAVLFGGPMDGATPLGDGTLCIGAPWTRIAQVVTGASGTATSTPSLPASGPGGVFSGAHWHLQAWYRDPGSTGTGSNLTSALRASFR